MNNFSDLYEPYTAADAKEDAYWEALEAFWYETRPAHIDKDWEELNWYEADNLRMQYSKHLEEEEAETNPCRYYMIEGRSR